MKRLTLLAVLLLAGCTIGKPIPQCTVTTHEGRTMEVFATRGTGHNLHYKVGLPFATGWVSADTLKSTTCSK